MEKLVEKFNNKKMIENAVIFLILAVIVMIVINSIFSSEENNQSLENKNNLENNIIANSNKVDSINVNNEIESRLREILSLINGAGTVDVMVTYRTDIEKIPMIDTKVTTTVINEKDNDGGERKTEETGTEENVVFEENGSTKSPVIKQEIKPQVIGVIVVAEGANNGVVRENLIKAVEAAIDVPTHRIQVFARKI